MDTFKDVLVYCDYEGNYVYKDICTTEIDEDGERVCCDYCSECDFCPINSYYNHEKVV